MEPQEIIKNIINGKPEEGTPPETERALGYNCNFVPPELILAAGFTPIRIFETASPSVISLGDTYMQRNSCPFVRGCIGNFLTGKYKQLQGVILSHTCDNMRGMAENLAYFKLSPTIIYQMDIPRNPDRENNYRYYTGQLEELKTVLEDLAQTKISEQKLADSIQVYARLRALLKQLHKFIEQPGSDFSAKQFYQLLHTVMVSHPQAHFEALKSLVGFLAQKKASSPQKPFSLLLLGSIMPRGFYQMLDILESSGASIVDDYICTGSEFFQLTIKHPNIDGLAREYLFQSPCARMNTPQLRMPKIQEKIQSNGISGIIYFSMKFCDAYLYDMHAIKALSQSMNIPFLFIESELSGSDSGQLSTRIQAFGESIRMKQRF
jgi:benzoyl-CoA reductase/2-hydroxyglutaryl-CoA dehydratase subunit BcrC/BadD/HgdB